MATVIDMLDELQNRALIFTNFLWQILNENNQNIKRNLWQKITGNKSNNWKNRR